jgi:hypothetical protein
MSTDPEARESLARAMRADTIRRTYPPMMAEEANPAPATFDYMKADVALAWMAEQGYSKPREADTDERSLPPGPPVPPRHWEGIPGAHPVVSREKLADDPIAVAQGLLRGYGHGDVAAALPAAGYSKQHPPTVTDEMVEAAIAAEEVAFRQMQVPYMRMRNILAAALGAVRPAPEPPTVEEWIERVGAERARHPEKGYDAAHDLEHGPDHLLNWAIAYSRRGEAEKSSSLIAAARDVLRAARPAPEPECICYGPLDSRCGMHGADAVGDATPTPQSDARPVQCSDHNPVQHRDARPPWCNRCGLTADYRKPVGPLDRAARPEPEKEPALPYVVRNGAGRLRARFESEKHAEQFARTLAGGRVVDQHGKGVNADEQ